MIFIQPINIDGTDYCPSQGAGSNRTDVVLDGAISVGTDKWRLLEGSLGSGTETGSIKFGTSCIQDISFEFNYDKDGGGDGSIVVKKNGVEVYSFTITLEGSTIEDGNLAFPETKTISASDRACGNVWEIIGTLPDSGQGQTFIDVEITSIT